MNKATEKGEYIMYSSVLSAITRGLEVILVTVETDVSKGLPSFQIVGSASNEVKESGERIRTAIKNLGYQLPPRKTIVNLTPAGIRKVGNAFDLPIAIGYLASHGIIDSAMLENILIMGEIGLDGNIHGIKGVLPILNECKQKGIQSCIIPYDNRKEGSLVDGVQVYGVKNLEEIISYLMGKTRIESYEKEDIMIQDDRNLDMDFGEIYGQEQMKRAVEIAVSGNHNILLIGPPGAGKSMVAKRVPGILPELDFQEKMEISNIYSIMGLLNEAFPFVEKRPFREVHHTITKSALIGGGNHVKPGELSLAHKGVLFLDELPEFTKSVLEVLRQPLEDGVVRISRNNGNYVFPADVMVVAAMNPCPCGNYPDLNRCSCTQYEVSKYLSKISQPFLERFDLCIDVQRVTYDNLKQKESNYNSSKMSNTIAEAVQVQEKRFQNTSITSNSQIPNSKIQEYCPLDSQCDALMKQAFDKLELSARMYYKIIKIARTIADIEKSEEISTAHISEAIRYRMIDKKYWR